jgi:Arc/MetJ-type ribon-helix-helix transcriptional regulator
MSPQIAVRVEQSLVEGLDAMVADGTFPTRAEAIRSAIETMLDEERRRKIGEAIVEGYRRIPQESDPDLMEDLDRLSRDASERLHAEEQARGLEW